VTGDQTLGNLLLGGFRWFDTALLNELARAGFTELRRPHSLVFAVLDQSGPTRIAEVARRLGITRQSAHQTVQELREMGLVELVRDPTNASARLVVPTSLGKRSIRTARRRYAELERELGRRISKDAVRALRRALERDWGEPP
jgi:DNA-binding MarR family transcriptional regulator